MKNKHSFRFLIVLLMTCCFLQGWSQSESGLPEIGKPMPDFTLTNVRNYEKTTVSLKDFRGKWLFLDFWSLGCSVCIKKFGENNEISNALKDKLVWLNVGINSKRFNSGIEPFYTKLAAYKHLTMPAAFDSTLEAKLGVENAPYIFMIDPKGMLYGISNGVDFNLKRIKDLIDGKEVKFNFRGGERALFEPLKDFKNKDSTLLMYQSILTRWSGEAQSGMGSIEESLKWFQSENSTEITDVGMPLFFYYDMAYFGKGYWTYNDSLYRRAYRRPVLQLRDSSKFEYSYEVELGKGLYNYQLRLPYKANKITCMKIMQQELQNVLGYTAAVEKRTIPIWKLVANPDAEKKLRSKGGVTSYPPRQYAAGFTITNAPASAIIHFLPVYVEDDRALSIIDATNLKGQVDFTISGDLTTIKGIQEALKSTPLHLERGAIDLDVVVIRDGDLANN